MIFSESNPAKIALIGVGEFSEYHHLPGINLDPRAMLTPICDADPVLLEKRHKRWKVDVASTDYEEICNHPDVDAVTVCTPNFRHVPRSCAATEAGKHIICENPLGLNAAEGRRMYETPRQTGWCISRLSRTVSLLR